MRRKLYSTPATIMAILYLLVAGYLLVDAWGCVTMLCDLLLVLWSMPTYVLIAVCADWFGWFEPGVASADGYEAVSLLILSLLGNTVLLYLLVFALEHLAKRIAVGIRARSK